MPAVRANPEHAQVAAAFGIGWFAGGVFVAPACGPVGTAVTVGQPASSDPSISSHLPSIVQRIPNHWYWRMLLSWTLMILFVVRSRMRRPDADGEVGLACATRRAVWRKDGSRSPGD